MTDISITQTFNNPRMVLEQIGLFVTLTANRLEEEEHLCKEHGLLLLALQYLGGLDAALKGTVSQKKPTTKQPDVNLPF